MSKVYTFMYIYYRSLRQGLYSRREKDVLIHTDASKKHILLQTLHNHSFLTQTNMDPTVSNPTTTVEK